MNNVLFHPFVVQGTENTKNKHAVGLGRKSVINAMSLEGIGIEAARKLTEATALLQQLEESVQRSKLLVADRQASLKEKQLHLQRLQRQHGTHIRNQDSLLHTLDAVNQKNKKLARDILTAREMRENLLVHAEAMGKRHSQVAQEADTHAINIQMMTAAIEEAQIVGDEESRRLKGLLAQRSTIERQSAVRDHELSRVRCQTDRVWRANSYVEESLK